jgi:hypothetical protein
LVSEKNQIQRTLFLSLKLKSVKIPYLAGAVLENPQLFLRARAGAGVKSQNFRGRGLPEIRAYHFLVLPFSWIRTFS